MREKEFLIKSYAAIFTYVGIIITLAGFMMLTPVLIIIISPEETSNLLSFVIPAGCLVFLGTVLRKFFGSQAQASLSVQEGGVIVMISWTLVILFSSWPFIAISGLSFSCALFESVSGWTTTGLSVVDVSNAGPMILFWRSIIQLGGGAGLAIIMMSAIIGPTSVSIPIAEGRSNQLLPHVRKSAQLVMIIYSCYAIIGTLAYFLAGMSFFDAANHAFCAISTGGFSTRPESIGFWNSVAIEAVTLPLMLLGNLSFVTAWLMWQGKFYYVIRNCEIRFIIFIVPLSVAAIFILTCQAIYPQFDKSLRVAVFETVTAITTTGFSTVNYGNWNAFGILMLIVLMLIGGGTCSTAGGIKQFRIYLLWKLFIWEIKRHFMPRTAILEIPIWEANHRVFVDDRRVRQVAVFVFLYLVTYLLGVMLLCAYGYSLSDSLFEFASAIGTVGLSVGVTSARMPYAVLWAEIFAMFLGRLEFIVVIVSVAKMVTDSRLILKRDFIKK